MLIQAVIHQAARQDPFNTWSETPPPYPESPPPPYPGPPPASTASLDTLRARNASRSHFRDGPPVRPRPTGTLLEDCIAAARNVELGVVRAMSEEDRKMVVARTLQAVATAASTSRSYPAFVAAVTYAEMISLNHAENPRRDPCHRLGYIVSDEDVERRRRHAFDTAIEAAMNANIAAGAISSNTNDISLGIAT